MRKPLPVLDLRCTCLGPALAMPLREPGEGMGGNARARHGQLTPSHSPIFFHSFFPWRGLHLCRDWCCSLACARACDGLYRTSSMPAGEGAPTPEKNGSFQKRVVFSEVYVTCPPEPVCTPGCDGSRIPGFTLRVWSLCRSPGQFVVANPGVQIRPRLRCWLRGAGPSRLLCRFAGPERVPGTAEVDPRAHLQP